MKEEIACVFVEIDFSKTNDVYKILRVVVIMVTEITYNVTTNSVAIVEASEIQVLSQYQGCRGDVHVITVQLTRLLPKWQQSSIFVT